MFFFSNLLLFFCVSQLSWIRQRDLHVLTSALVSYTSDGRFSVHHQPANDDWELRISSVQARDAGFCKFASSFTKTRIKGINKASIALIYLRQFS